PTRVDHRLGIVPCQIAADSLPCLTAVGGLPHMLRRGVEDCWIDGRENDRVGPLPPLLERARGLAGEEARIGAYFPQLTGPAIEPRQECAVVRAGVEDVRILRVWRNIARLAASDHVRSHEAPASAAEAASATQVRAAVDAHGRVVLLRAAHVVGNM